MVMVMVMFFNGDYHSDYVDGCDSYGDYDYGDKYTDGYGDSYGNDCGYADGYDEYFFLW